MKRLLLVAALAAALSTPAFAAPVGVGISAGTMGLGLALALPIVPGVLNTRLIANGGGFHHRFATGGLSYAATAQFRNAVLLADYYPFQDLFHVSAGVFYNDNRVNLTAIPAQGYYNIDGFRAPATVVGPVSGQIRFGRFAPYFGLGWGNLASGNTGFTFAVDVGVIWQKPHATLNAPGAAGNPNLAVALQDARDQIQAQANRFKMYPVVSVSVGYRFR